CRCPAPWRCDELLPPKLDVPWNLLHAQSDALLRTIATSRPLSSAECPRTSVAWTRSDRVPAAPYLASAAWAAAIFAFTASRLKLAPFCMGGYSIAVWANAATCCWTNTKRQNSYLNQSKYCCPPSLVPLSGQPVRSNG